MLINNSCDSKGLWICPVLLMQSLSQCWQRWTGALILLMKNQCTHYNKYTTNRYIMPLLSDYKPSTASKVQDRKQETIHHSNEFINLLILLSVIHHWLTGVNSLMLINKVSFCLIRLSVLIHFNRKAPISNFTRLPHDSHKISS